MQFQEDTQPYDTHLPVMMPANEEGKANVPVRDEGRFGRNEKGTSKGYSQAHSLSLHRYVPHFVLHEIPCK